MEAKTDFSFVREKVSEKYGSNGPYWGCCPHSPIRGMDTLPRT